MQIYTRSKPGRTKQELNIKELICTIAHCKRKPKQDYTKTKQGLNYD